MRKSGYLRHTFDEVVEFYLNMYRNSYIRVCYKHHECTTFLSKFSVNRIAIA